jgi:alkanesulfonate monooxygenase SsuD/methylene tetrahydromethanopterin reductase-like flavin-dependent oxidoreductase (luciferase family)
MLPKLGMFLMPVHDPAKPLAQCFDEDLELVVRCEALGFDEFWVGEHHSSNCENIVMPEIFIGKALGITKEIRLGPAPVCLQYHHPVHVAGRLAFLDHLSHGRLNVCFGPGAIPTDLEVFGVEPAETSARVAEAIDMILKIWTSDPPYEIQGRFWQVQLKRCLDAEMGLGTLHKPLQRPYPPIHAPCISRNSPGLKHAGARGFIPISHHMVAAGVLENHWQTYRAGAESAGRAARHQDWKVARNILVAETSTDARRLARGNSLGKCIEYILELTRRGPGLGMWKRDPGMSDADCNLDYFLDEVIIAGNPDEVVRRLRELRERAGDFGTLILVAHDWDDKKRWLNSLELFAREVMPRLRAPRKSEHQTT